MQLFFQKGTRKTRSVSDDLADKIKRADIHANVYGSDHCPIYLNIDMSEPVVRNDIVTNLTYDDLLMREKRKIFFSALKDIDLTRAWNTVDWDKAKEHLKKLQKDVALACFDKWPDSIKNAQFKLVSSLDAKLLAVKAVTSRNARTGVDHVKWETPDEKMHAALSLTSKDYHAKPARILEKTDQGKLRHFHIDTYFDRAMQALYGYSLAPVAETWSDRKSFNNRKFRCGFDVNYYICKLYSGEDAPLWAFKTDVQKCYEYKTSNVAKFWRIRSGITQGDTALNTEVNLALALENYGVSDVDFATVWGQGHTEAERKSWLLQSRR